MRPKGLVHGLRFRASGLGTRTFPTSPIPYHRLEVYDQIHTTWTSKPPQGSGFRGLLLWGFRAYTGFNVQGSEFRGRGSGFKLQGSGSMI